MVLQVNTRCFVYPLLPSSFLLLSLLLSFLFPRTLIAYAFLAFSFLYMLPFLKAVCERFQSVEKIVSYAIVLYEINIGHHERKYRCDMYCRNVAN